ncbi:MAG: hypothetical protein U0L27_06270 [Ruminococcus sp.]|nr:hypothetical protein [Ruminococcus sp.]
MKKLLTAITSAVLCMTMLIIAPTQIVASAAENEQKYISEVKVGMGVTSDQASKELLDEGYTILKDDNGNYADLNKDAGAASPMKEGPNQKIVYLGYKTTSEAGNAITDLAVMNMKGGYSFEDYEKLMQTHLDTQIKPFVDRFIATLKEYRENLQKPQDSANYKRSNYYKALLNKLTDDDTGGKPLGDLLVNQTKYEMGDEAYNALSDEEKKNHCDILTLLMQGNGQAILLMETELTKSADSSNSTWVDRFKETSLDKLTKKVKNENPNMTPSEINKELDKLYNDDAKKILEKWEAFNEILINYDNAGENIKKAVEGNTADKSIDINENSTDSEIQEAATKASDTQTKAVTGGLAAEEIAAHDYLETVEYGDGTMLEFFERDKSEFEDSENIRELYPIVDSLTGGQLAGLDFLSIKDMVVMALTDENGFKKVDLNDVLTASIYQDVNREIYEKGGVALTDAAMRAKATAQEATPTFKLSTLGSVLWTCTAVSGAAAAASAIAHAKLKNSPYLKALTEYQDKMKSYQTIMNKDGKGFGNLTSDQKTAYKNLLSKKNAYENSEVYQKALFKSNITKYLAAGFTVLGAVLAGVSIYTTIEEMKAFYKVEFTPIPKYIVDRADITAVNQKGETVMVKNQTAYYKAVLCNRTAGSSAFEKKNYEILKDRNDLNGDVGMQWLSLYSVKYENGTPILADSLKVKLGNGDAPEGYTNGIHRFGEKDVVFNLTSRLYCYNDPSEGTYVYFKNDTSTVKDLTAAGSSFSGGSLALGIGAGSLAGCALTLLLLKVNNKKKKNGSATA